MLLSKILSSIILFLSGIQFVLIGKSITGMAQQIPFESRVTDLVAWSQSGTQIAFSTSDWVPFEDDYLNHQIRIISIQTNQIILSIPLDDLTNASQLSWQNNDTELMVITTDGDVKRFNAQNGDLIAEWTSDISLRAASVHPNNQFIAFALQRLITGNHMLSTDKIIEVRDRITGVIQQSLVLPVQADDRVDWIGWSPDGTRLAVINHDQNALIYAWNGSSLSLQYQITFTSNDSLPIYAAWGPNSRQIAITTRQSPTLPSITIFNSEDGTVIRQLQQSTGGSAVVWSTQTNMIAAREGWAARVWNGANGQVVEDLDYTNQYFFALDWSPNGTLAVGRLLTYDELAQNPNLTGVVTQRPSSLPTLTPTPTPTATNTPTATPTQTPSPTPYPCPCTLFGTSVPANPSNIGNPPAVNLGVVFKPSVNGQVTGIRFYKLAGNGGTHTGYLWSAAGTLLGSVTFTGETATGWQTATFATPINVTANTVYVASYHAPQGRFAYDNNTFTTGRSVPPLYALATGETSPGNGTYIFGAAGLFPNATFNATNYWVDVVFVPA